MEDIQTQLGLFYDAWRRIDLQYDRYARSLGLSATSMLVLYYIYKGHDTCTQTSICEKTQLPKQTVHSVVLGFVRDGTILLTESKASRRKRLVLSGAGRKFCEQAFERLDQSEYDTMLQFPEEQRAQLISLMTQYAAAFEATMK